MRGTLTGLIVTIIFVLAGVVWLAAKIEIVGTGAVTVPGMPANTEPVSLLSVIASSIASGIGSAVRAIFGGWFGWG